MMTMSKYCLYLAGFLFGFCSNCLQAQQEDFHLRALGSLRYTLASEWNHYDLYHLGGNPAGLHDNDTLKWLQVWNENSFTRGDFRRFYDPKKINYTTVAFAGSKPLDEHQTFWGKVIYASDQLIGVPFALERNPYEADPFILADSSSGGFQFWGPQVEIIYSRQLSQRLDVGAQLEYVLDSAVRDHESRVKIIQRNLLTRLGVTIKLLPGFNVGITYCYQNLFDNTEVPTRQDGRNPITYRYRGYLVSRRELNRYVRNALTRHHQVASQWLVQPGSALTLLVQGGYCFQYSDLFDGTSVRYYEAYWERHDYSFDFVGKYSPLFSPWTLTGFTNYNFTSAWSKHYRLPVLISDQTQGNLESGLGLGYAPAHRNYRFGTEISAVQEVDHFVDYIGHTVYDVKILSPELRIGGEYFLSELISLQLGGQWLHLDQCGEIPYHAGSYHSLGISFGFTLWQKNYLVELISNFSRDREKHSPFAERYRWALLMNSKFNLE